MRGRLPELRTLSVPLALNYGRALLAQRPSRQAGKSWGKFSSMGVGRGVDCGRAVHLAEARGAITARQVALTRIDDRIVAGATIIDERQARGHSVHLSIGHLSCRDRRSLRLLVLLDILRHCRS